MKERIYHQGIPVDNLSHQEALEEIKTLLDSGPSCSHIVSLTIGMYDAARRCGNFREILGQAALVIPESTGLSLYSNICPPRLVNTPGGYLIREVVGFCAETGRKVVLFGSSEENRKRAASVLDCESSGLKIEIVSGEYDFSNPTDSVWVASQIDLLSPDLAIMAGHEVEAETWINHWLGEDISLGVVGNFGQTIDVWAGQRWVPPQFLRDRGVGWMLRLVFESLERRNRYAKVLLAFGKIALLDTFNRASSRESL